MQNAWRFIDDEILREPATRKPIRQRNLAPRPTTNKAAEKIPVPFERHARPAKAGKAGRPPSCTRRRRPTSRRSAEAADRNLTTRATQPTETGLAGWRGRIRTTESIRIVSAVAVEGVAEAVAVALQVGIALQDQVFHVVRQSEVSGRIDFRGPQQFNTIIGC
jgi:hypothetical protein